MFFRLAFCAAILTASLPAADTKQVSKTLSLDPRGSVTLETFQGSIHVSTWDRGEIAIEARIESAGSSEGDRRRFDHTDVAIDASPNSVRIKTKVPDMRTWFASDHGSNPLVHYTIRLPKTARLGIRDHVSETEVTGLAGELDFNTHRGHARLTGLAGPLQVQTHRGEVRAEFASFSGASRVGTYRGRVELVLPKDSRFDLRTEFDRRGRVESDFPVMARLARHGGSILEGEVNGGGPELRLNTYRGEIRIRAER